MVPSLLVSTVVNLHHFRHLATPPRICSTVWFCVRTDHKRNCARLEGGGRQQPSQAGSADWHVCGYQFLSSFFFFFVFPRNGDLVKALCMLMEHCP